jgi:4-hydroxy-tetrahydrodipicolinate reductase
MFNVRGKFREIKKSIKGLRSMEMIKLAVSGACGRMGSRIISKASEDRELKVILGLERKGHEMIGKIMGDFKVSDDPEDIKDADVLVEFTNPEATMEHLYYALKYKKPLVIGTTGLSEEQTEKIKEAARLIPIVFSPNMSIGVNLLFKLVKEAAEFYLIIM